MDETEDTEQATSPTTADRAAEVAQGPGGRPDNRNEELDQSPIPDPEAKDTSTADDPGAD